MEKRANLGENEKNIFTSKTNSIGSITEKESELYLKSRKEAERRHNQLQRQSLQKELKPLRRGFNIEQIPKQLKKETTFKRGIPTLKRESKQLKEEIKLSRGIPTLKRESELEEINLTKRISKLEEKLQEETKEVKNNKKSKKEFYQSLLEKEDFSKKDLNKFSLLLIGMEEISIEELGLIAKLIIKSKSVSEITFLDMLIILKESIFFFDEIWVCFEREIKKKNLFDKKDEYFNCVVIFGSFLTFYSHLLQKLPLYGKNINLENLDNILKKFLKFKNFHFNFCISKEEINQNEKIVKLSSKLKKLKNILEANKDLYDKEIPEAKKKLETQEINYNFSESFRDLSAYPSFEDMNKKRSDLKPLKIDKPYTDLEEYLEVNFRLLKEDYLGSLRDKLEEFKNPYNKKRKYFEGYMVSSVEDKKFIGFDLEVEKKFRRNFSWKISNKLMIGGLVMFSPDNFLDEIYFAIVRSRDENKMNLTTQMCGTANVGVEIIPDRGLKPSEIYQKVLGKKLKILDSDIFFEYYYKNMVFMRETNFLSLQMELIQCIQKKDFSNENTNKPKYMIDNNYFENIVNQTLNNHKLTLDESQKLAILNCFENNVALVQGPPGTGKTYIGVAVADILNTFQKYDFDRIGPILLVCYTNHALDQFLEKIIKFEKNVIRMGGNSKNKEIDKFSFENVKLKMRKEKKIFLPRGIFNLFDLVKKKLNQIKKLKSLFIPFPFFYEEKFTNNYILTNILNRFEQKISKTVKNILQKIFLKDFKSKLDLMEKFEFFLNLNTNEIGIHNISILNYLGIFDINIFETKFINYLSFLQKNKEEDLDTAYLYFLNQKEENCYRKNVIIDNDKFKNCNTFINKKIFSLDPEKKQFTYKEWFEKDKYSNSPEYQQISNIHEYIFSIFRKNINYYDDDEREYFESEEDDDDREYFERNNDFPTKENIHEVITKLSKEIIDHNFIIDSLYAECDAEILNKARFIAMTSYGALKYKNTINKLNSKVLIVEEAGELLDCQLITSLTKNTEHLILIGDHKQLRPKLNNYELVLHYNFDISLFERLINCQFKQVTLTTQRRMRPEIADITRLTYPQLQDGEQIKNKENIQQLPNVFFFTHEWPEIEDEESRSKINVKEAEFIIKFTELLVNIGYKEEHITILSLYLGQLILIKRLINNEKILKNVLVVTVDNYQGEENEIIILSLVRSNKNGKIGFLSINNRLNVALSRAKKGMFLFGNASTIRDYENNISKNPYHQTSLWSDVLKYFINKKLIIESIILKCDNHGELIEMKEIKDFEKCPEGGCKNVCQVRMNCGHQCKRFCHKHSLSFDDIDGHSKDNKSKCKEPCGKKHFCSHPCKTICYNCKPENIKCLFMCKVILLKCQHELNVPCYQTRNPDSIFCDKKCEKILPCGHICAKKCGNNCEFASNTKMGFTSDCREKVKTELKCGHEQKVECRFLNSSKLGEVECFSKCGKNLKCGHPCSAKCEECLNLKKEYGEDFHSGFCEKKCERILPCEHLCQDYCSSEFCGLCKEKCKKKCDHGLCPKECGESCKECIEKCRYQCPHFKCEKKCFEICDRPPCNKRCEKNLKCGHPCLGFCGEDCPTLCRVCQPEHEDFQGFFGGEENKDVIFIKLDCGHNIESKAMDYSVYKDDNDKNAKNEILIRKLECPKCKTVLNNCMRYQNKIKKINSYFDQIKKRIKNSISNMEEENNQIVNFVKGFEDSYNFELKSANKNQFKRLNANFYLENFLKREQINLINFRLMMLKEFLNLYNNINHYESKIQFLKKTGFFLNLLSLSFGKNDIEKIQNILEGIQLEYIKKNVDFEKLEIKKVLSSYNLKSLLKFSCVLCGCIYLIGGSEGMIQKFNCLGYGGNCQNILGR